MQRSGSASTVRAETSAFVSRSRRKRPATRLRRPDFYIAVGRPFHLDPGADKVTGAVRQQMVDEIMFQIASLLPPAYRGFYSDTAAATERYLCFV